MKFVIGRALTILSWDNPVTAFFRKSRKLRHSLGRPSRSDFVHFEFTDADKSKVYTHDLKTLDDIVKAYYSVDKRIVVYYDQISPYLQDYFFDTKGDVFKYETDYNGNPHLIKLGISSIGYDVLKRKYNEMMVLFDKLIFEMMYLCQEYAVGTFTKNLSREDIRNIAVKLLPRKQWRNNAFDECKTKIKLEYGIGSKEFSEALNIIQNHREFCTYIDMEQKLYTGWPVQLQ